MKHISSLIVAFVFTACNVTKESVFENPSGPVSRKIVLDSQIIVQSGGASRAVFTLESGLTPPLHDCSHAQIQAMVINPGENFASPNAKLEIYLECLKCAGYDGEVFTRKITGTIEGDEFSGQDAHGSIDGREFLGMGVSAGSRGTALISDIGSDSADCWT